MPSTFPKLPAVGATFNGRFVIQAHIDRYAQRQAEISEIRAALREVVKEFSDLGTGLPTNEELPRVASLSSDTQVRECLKERIIKSEGTSMLGGIKLSPASVASMIDVGEINQFIAACQRLENTLYANRTVSVKDFAITPEGTVEVTTESVKRLINTCLITGKSDAAARLLKVATELVKIQAELDAEFSSLYNPFQLSELVLKNTDGEFVPNGGAILQRAGEIDSYGYVG